MPNRFDESRDYGFAERVLALRQRAGLTQAELAALLRVALNIMGETVGTLFGGQIASFPGTGGAGLRGIRQLLAEQVERLSPVERTVATCLTVEREPVGLMDLAVALEPATARGEVLEAVAALQRRSLLEQGEQGSFTLQPVVLEYVTGRLVEAVSHEILTGETGQHLVSHVLVKAGAPDFVRRSQERMIAGPVLDRLRGSVDGSAGAERQLFGLLDSWRARSRDGHGYGPGNVVNLLRLLRHDLRGLDLSGLTIRQAYLQEVEAQDASLAGAHFSGTVLGDSFAYSSAVALSRDGA
jgi:transcriptional regulator with XRE-family HTH domain